MDLKEIVRITNVLYDAKTVKIVNLVTFVPKKDVFHLLAKNTVIVDWATSAFLKIVLLDANVKETVHRMKYVLKTIVPLHQVFIF